jgi:UDP-GlcNAc3NAcA epimerase
MVYGDTNTTLAGAVAAAKLHIPIAHVEAGLRSFNRHMPEEVNRVLTDHCSDLLFTPTSTASEHLRNEGIETGVYLVGDVMYDAALQYSAVAESKSDILSTLGLKPSQYILATIHRAENTSSPQRLRTIITAFAELAHHVPIIMPIHPRTRHAALKFGIGLQANGINVIDSLGYLDMVMLQRFARVIVTDSGGMQKESFFYRVPCVTLRGETEWTELLHAGWNRLAPPENSETVVREVEAALDSKPESNGNFYGDGHAGEKIVDILLRSGVCQAEQPSLTVENSVST